MSKTNDEFKEMLENAETRRQEESDEGLAKLIQAWPYMTQEDRDKVFNIAMLDLAMTEAAKGSKLRRAWHWLKAWWYQLPWFWAR
jgi:hypothetical protein